MTTPPIEFVVDYRRNRRPWTLFSLGGVVAGISVVAPFVETGLGVLGGAVAGYFTTSLIAKASAVHTLHCRVSEHGVETSELWARSDVRAWAAIETVTVTFLDDDSFPTIVIRSPDEPELRIHWGSAPRHEWYGLVDALVQHANASGTPIEISDPVAEELEKFQGAHPRTF